MSEQSTGIPKKIDLKISKPELNISPEKITPTITDLYELLLDYSNEIPDHVVHSTDKTNSKVTRTYWSSINTAMYIVNKYENSTETQKEIGLEYKKLIKEAWQDKKATLYDEKAKEYVTPVSGDEINRSDSLICRFLGINYEEYLAYKNQATDKIPEDNTKLLV